MEIRWLTVFVDQPSAAFDRGTRFWQDVTGSGRSPLRGDDEEFATLLPPNGDPSIRVQRLRQGAARLHLDLHVDSIPEARAQAMELGATVLSEPGHVVMASPAGLTFCLVPHHGEATPPAPYGADRPYRVDQVCLDIPNRQFDDEADFWQSLTGWERRSGALDEFSYLVRPPGIALRLLLQRLGDDDPSGVARAHIDVACGPNVDEIASAHEAFGAELVERFPIWTTLRDPAGLAYCLTRRDPTTGRLPPGSY